MDYNVQQERRMRAEKRRQRELRRKKLRRKRIIFLSIQGLFLVVGIILLVEIKQTVSQMKELAASSGNVNSDVIEGANNLVGNGSAGLQGGDYVEQCGLYEVDTPIQREPQEVLTRLEILAEEYDLIEEVLQDTSIYPENMLEALAITRRWQILWQDIAIRMEA